MGGTLSQIVFQPPRYPEGPPHDADFIPLTTKGGETIQSLHIKGGDGSLTLLYSHGNAEDILAAKEYFKHLAALCQVDVFLFDYVGYGCSSGKPSERGVYESIEAAYEYLTQKLHIHPSTIIAYGRSLGSGPSVHLCMHHELGGLILQSALLSIHRVALQLRVSLPFDMFVNRDKIHKVKCPVFCIHGTNDEVVPLSHGIELYKRAPLRASPFWVEGAGHNNLEVTARRHFFAALRRFIKLVIQRNSQLQQQQQQQQQQREESAVTGLGSAAAASASTPQHTQGCVPHKKQGPPEGAPKRLVRLGQKVLCFTLRGSPPHGKQAFMGGPCCLIHVRRGLGGAPLGGPARGPLPTPAGGPISLSALAPLKRPPTLDKARATGATWESPKSISSRFHLLHAMPVSFRGSVRPLEFKGYKSGRPTRAFKRCANTSTLAMNLANSGAPKGLSEALSDRGPPEIEGAPFCAEERGPSSLLAVILPAIALEAFSEDAGLRGAPRGAPWELLLESEEAPITYWKLHRRGPPIEGPLRKTW
ncbi:hypothetical protein Emed_002573 [Eimeria media]